MFHEGDILDGYLQIICEIGKGGTGVIYKAYHLRLQKYVVIKKIKESVMRKMDVQRETDILKTLHHSYLPQIYDSYQNGPEAFSVMDYIEGYDLKQYVESGYFFSEEELVRWLGQLAEVLEYLHTRTPRIIHSDIKPANIMITNEGNVCLIDFNIAMSGEKTTLLGLSQYFSSPEQYEIAWTRGISDIQIDERTDIYSLGATFYYMMTGCLPEPGTKQQIQLEAYSLPYSDGLIGLVDRMMMPDREKRYATAADISYALNYLEKQSHGHRLRMCILAVSAAGAAILILILTAALLIGSNSRKKTNFVATYDAMVEAYENGEYDEALSAGFDILNRSSWQSYLDSDTRGEICRMIADVYADEGEYAQACTYYKMAVDYGVSYVTLYKNYAVALVKCGNISEAESVLAQAETLGISDADSAYIQAQIYWQQGSADEAAEKLLESLNAISLSTNRERRQAAAFSYTVAVSTGDSYRSELLSWAAALYDAIIYGGYPTQDDYLNLAIVYIEDGDYNSAKEILTALTGQSFYMEEYRSYALLAQSCYEIAVADASESGEFDSEEFAEIMTYCEKALELAESSGGSDTYTDIAEQILGRLEGS